MSAIRFETVWNLGLNYSSVTALRNLQPCDVRRPGANPLGRRSLPPGSAGGGSGEGPPWAACKGSTPEARGFTCGLWMMFHTVAIRCGG